MYPRIDEDVTEWYHTFKEFRDWEHFYDWQDSMFAALESIEEQVKQDPLEYLYHKYYREDESYEGLSAVLLSDFWIEVPVRTIARWITEYFMWEPKEDVVGGLTRGRMSESAKGNKNGSIVHKRYREETEKNVWEILWKVREEEKKEFDNASYSSLKWPKKRIIYILMCSWFGTEESAEAELEWIIIQQKDKWIWIQATATIINVLVQKLLILMEVNIKAPELSKQTVKSVLKKHFNRESDKNRIKVLSMGKIPLDLVEKNYTSGLSLSGEMLHPLGVKNKKGRSYYLQVEEFSSVDNTILRKLSKQFVRNVPVFLEVLKDRSCNVIFWNLNQGVSIRSRASVKYK